MASSVAHRVGLVVFPGCDLMDVGGPYEVFLTASRLAVRRGEAVPFDVLTIAAGTTAGAGAGLDPGAGRAPGVVPTYGPLAVVPTRDTAAVADLTLAAVVVPGAVDVAGMLADEQLVADVRDLAGRADVVASVCTGSFLLAAAGLLAGRAATTHWEDLDDLAGHPQVAGTGAAVYRARWVDDGDVVTGGGLTNGIAMALHLVDRLAGRGLAVATARQLDYPWEPDEL